MVEEPLAYEVCVSDIKCKCRILTLTKGNYIKYG